MALCSGELNYKIPNAYFLKIAADPGSPQGESRSWLGPKNSDTILVPPTQRIKIALYLEKLLSR